MTFLALEIYVLHEGARDQKVGKFTKTLRKKPHLNRPRIDSISHVVSSFLFFNTDLLSFLLGLLC
jgi:hypothetical protein